jgi:CDP-diacylglycerol--glycerol-3-phosphate 3-phosphatidyltransferase
MTSVSTSPVESRLWNLPNQITTARLVLTVAVFTALGVDAYLVALVLFLAAAGTDWVDGYIARRYQMVTQVGRMLDPFADKLLICGALIFLVEIPGSQVAAWVAVVVVARELLITAIRSFLEQQGQDFSAKMAGKLKMVFQTGLVVASLVLLAIGARAPGWLPWLVWVLALVTVISTIQSGLGYVLIAMRMINHSTSA